MSAVFPYICKGKKRQMRADALNSGKCCAVSPLKLSIIT